MPRPCLALPPSACPGALPRLSHLSHTLTPLHSPHAHLLHHVLGIRHLLLSVPRLAILLQPVPQRLDAEEQQQRDARQLTDRDAALERIWYLSWGGDQQEVSSGVSSGGPALPLWRLCCSAPRESGHGLEASGQEGCRVRVLVHTPVV